MDRDAQAADFDAFYSARGDALVRTLYLKTGDLERARDCAQEALVRAWMDWSRVRNKNPAAWVRAVAWNLAVSDWRSAARERIKGQRTAALAHSDPMPHESVLVVRGALEQLTDDQRAATVLFYFEDMTVQEVAKLMSVPEGTVKSLLHRARGVLREQLTTTDDVLPSADQQEQGEPRWTR